MRIEELKKSQRKRGRFLVKMEDGSLLRITENEVVRFALRPGLELGLEDMEALQASAKTSSAKAAAANMVGSRTLSKKELTDRLLRKGTEEAEARAAVDWLEDLGAVNDGEYAAALVRHYGSRGYGPARVREELRRRGVGRELWDAALEELPDPAEVLDGLIRKKQRAALSDRRELKRLSDSLLRRGFSWGDVKAALRRYADIEECD